MMRTLLTNYIIELALLLVSYLYWFTGKTLEDTYLVCTIVLVYYGARFVYELGKKIVFLDAVILMAIGQWLYVTAIVYLKESKMFLFEDIYSEMPIPQEEYFSVALPATFLFFAGVHLPIVSVRQDVPFYKERIKAYFRFIKVDHLGAIIFGVGLFTTFASKVLPIPGFISFIFSNLIYVGFFYALFTKSKYNVLVYIGTIAQILLSTLGGALSTLVLWSFFIITMLFAIRDISFISKIGLFAGGFLIVFVLQSVKSEYRDVVWRGEGLHYTSKQKLDLAVSLIGDRLSGQGLFSSESSGDNLIRFNQGFLIAHAIDYVPDVEPFANGETVVTALMASFVPRFLWPDKPVAGGRANMHRFTRLRMVGSTSMNISALGDGYVNYGPYGAAVFLFLFGVVLNLLNSMLFKYAETTPSLLFWIPTVYIAVVVVETDFVTVFNHAVKSSIFIWIAYMFSRKILGVRI